MNKSIYLRDETGEIVYDVTLIPSGAQFEIAYFARRGHQEPDLEEKFELESETVKSIFQHYGLSDTSGVLEGFQAISDKGLTSDLQEKISEGVFPVVNRSKWMSWPD